MRWLEPPWELVRTDGTTAIVRVKSNAMIHAGPEVGVPKYELVVTVEPGTVSARVQAEIEAAAARDEEVVAGPRAVEADRGTVIGQEVLTLGSYGPYERHGRYAFFPVDASRVVRLAFEATPSLDTAEVDAMIAEFSIGSDGP